MSWISGPSDLRHTVAACRRPAELPDYAEIRLARHPAQNGALSKREAEFRCARVDHKTDPGGQGVRRDRRLDGDRTCARLQPYLLLGGVVPSTADEVVRTPDRLSGRRSPCCRPGGPHRRLRGGHQHRNGHRARPLLRPTQCVSTVAAAEYVRSAVRPQPVIAALSRMSSAAAVP